MKSTRSGLLGRPPSFTLQETQCPLLQHGKTPALVLRVDTTAFSPAGRTSFLYAVSTSEGRWPSDLELPSLPADVTVFSLTGGPIPPPTR